MLNVKYVIILLVLLCSILSCDNNKTKVHHYENQIGDTPFNPELDDLSFKFCDSSTNVLHKRALIKYTGGFNAMQEDLISAYTLKESYTSFSGSIIVRFAVNCIGELGRFRSQTVDSNSSKTEAPKGLEAHIFSIIKEMKGWNRAYYKGSYADCYTFTVVKFKQGEIIFE